MTPFFPSVVPNIAAFQFFGDSFCHFIFVAFNLEGATKELQSFEVTLSVAGMFPMLYVYKQSYRKVVSSSLSRLVAHFQIFRRLMKGKFDAYVL